MLGEKKILQVQERIGSGASFRNISRATGVSRNTVSKIAHGKHSLQLRPSFIRTDPARCPSCGERVVLTPCPACTAERSSSPRLSLSPGPVSLGVDLHGAEKLRYLEVREKVRADIAAGRRRPLDGLHLDSD